MKGSRIHGIVRELGNENIDVSQLHNKFTTIYNACSKSSKSEFIKNQ